MRFKALSVGNKNDGGYIVHEPSLPLIDILVPYGVGYNVEFEKNFNEITGASVMAFDPTMKDPDVFIIKIKHGNWLITLKQFRWLMKWIYNERGLKRNKINFIQEGIAVSDEKKYKSFDTHIIEHKLSDKTMLLKINIDGGEYKLFKDKKFLKTWRT